MADNDSYLIAHRPGATGRAIISFSGIGAFRQSGGLPHPEFVKMLSDNDDHQYFVVDKLRSWYNATGEAIREALNKRLPQHDSCLTLGNSMGGFGAVYFASRLANCKAAVAFGPQFSVHPEFAPAERRWMRWRLRIESWTAPHALIDADPSVPFYLFFGDATDKHQLRLFRRHALPRMSIFVLPGQAHHTARHLLGLGLLMPVIEAAFRGDEAEALRSMLNERGIPTH